MGAVPGAVLVALLVEFSARTGVLTGGLLALLFLVRTMATAAVAAVASLAQEPGSENEQAVLKIIVEPWLQFRVLPR